jgi:hypothetical protein
MNGIGMGGKPRPQSDSDKQLGSAQAPVVIPSVYMPDYSALPVKMQGTYGTCGGHAGSAFESFLEGTDLSPKYLWKNIVAIQPNAVTNGTDMKTVLQTLSNVGDCREMLCPDVLDPTIQEYSSPSTITEEMYDDAYPNGLLTPAYTNSPTWEAIRQAIYQNKVVIALVKCGDGWYTALNGEQSWRERDVLPLRLGNYVDGHFIVLWGYDDKYIYFRNSWSSGWGKLGDGYFDVTYLPNIIEIGTAIVGPSIKQRIKSLYETLVGVLTQLLNQLKPKTS